VITSTPIRPDQIGATGRPFIDSGTHRPSSQAGFAAVLMHR
jgi:hypothetical protein